VSASETSRLRRAGRLRCRFLLQHWRARQDLQKRVPMAHGWLEWLMVTRSAKAGSAFGGGLRLEEGRLAASAVSRGAERVGAFRK